MHGQVPAEPSQDPAEDKGEPTEEEAMQDLALEEQEWNDGHRRDSDEIPVVHWATGRAYKSLEEMITDPAYPMGPAGGTWQEEASTPEEIVNTYRAAEPLSWKISHISDEHRQDVASACWYALQCMRNICARYGGIVESAWIERERFVVIRLKESEGLRATGRIVIGPSGAYTYRLALVDREVLGAGGREWGTKFFPMGSVDESFQEYGWPSKGG